jgi:ubiquinone/menaquinone biosynthesis C-methylase UbiE
MNLPRSVSRYWRKHRIWDRYQEEQHPVIGRILQEQRGLTVAAVREFAEPRPTPVDVADLGCGTGCIANDVTRLEKVRSLLAIDINESSLRQAAARAAQQGLQEKFRFLSGDLYELDWGGERSFDAVVAIDMLHHMPDIPALLAAIRRRLKDDGILIGNLRSRERTDVFFNRYGLVNRTLIRLQPAFDRVLPENSFLRRWLGSAGYFRIRTFSRADAERLLENAGFHVVRMESSSYHWFVCTIGRT